MLRTVADQPTLWEAILPEELRRLPAELARVDALLDDPVFFTPFVPFFDPRMGRPSTPMETYLRLMFLKFRYRLGYESLCREVSDSITWRQFCRIGIDQPVPHPTTLMKLTTRCGSAAVDGLNEALLAKAVEAKVLRCTRVRVDTTVVPSNVAYPTDSGLLAKAVNRIAATGRRIQAAGGAVRTKLRDRSRAAGRRAHDLNAKLRTRNAAAREEALAVVRRKNAELADLAETAANEAERLLANAKRALRTARRTAAERRRPTVSRTRRRAAPWPAGPGGQRPGRAAGGDPADRRADPATARRHHPGRRDPAGQPARSRRPPDREGPARETGRVRPQGPGVSTTTTASCSTTTCSRATRPTRPRLKPAVERVIKPDRTETRTVAADRGYGEAGVDDAPPRPRRPQRRDPPQRQTQQGPTSRRTPTSVPPTREMANRLRRPDQPPQTQLRMGPHHDRHHRRSPDLDRTRSPRPQPHQDRALTG